MKNILLLVMAFAIMCWAVPKPMESIENYNVLMVHGAYGPYNDDGDLQGFEHGNYSQALESRSRLGTATMGSYTSGNRVTKWISHNILEEPEWDNDSSYVRNSYVYNWRAFSNTRNSSKNNAFELGDRTWNKDNRRFGHRRALVEEAQEVKAKIYNQRLVDDSVIVDSVVGQSALEIIRQNPDLYRQLASRYILIGHSMGGVVSREYVQNSDYYHGDVDKIITLDSPHEGTGALNMQLDMQNIKSSALEGLTSSIPIIAATATALWIAGKDVPSLIVAGQGLALSLGIAGAQLGIGEIIALGLEQYETSDSIVCYVDPHFEKNDFCNGDEPSISDLKNKINVPDSLPMFRMVAGENSMVFTDPKLGVRRGLSVIIPDAITVPFANLTAQFSGGNSFKTNFVNSMTGMAAGLLGGVNVQDHGSALVETNGGLALGTNMFTHADVDVRRYRFNAAYESSGSLLSDVAESTLIMGATAAITIDAVILTAGMFRKVAKIGVGFATAMAFAPSVGSAIAAGILDLSNSHNYPIDKIFKEWQVGGYNGYTNSLHVYEDFLYEKPFVNLALNDSRTMDSLSRMGEDARESSTLNRNCFYGADVDEDEQLCEIGLYGKDSSGFVPFKRKNYVDFKASPLKFKSASDWSTVGMKLDRWERVAGLTPEGEEEDSLVPIRHVERYNVPAITVEDWIEKYSFVVDDLMPHRLRQIRMNFNYQEEIAWECDITKNPEANDACQVFKRSGGGDWALLKTEKHPVKKNGQFDFEPGKYGYNNLLALQKDNQNTVTISTVNKIGLSNTQRFYYLFKATDNMLQPSWPKRDVVLNKVKNFKAYASALGYQGFYVAGATDTISSLIDGESSDSKLDPMDMEIEYYYDNGQVNAMNPNGIVYDSSSAYFKSRKSDPNPAEGDYLWRFFVDIRNSAEADSKDSSNTYEVPFRVDRTAPSFTLSSEGRSVNPDSNSFAVRFSWAGSENAADIRAMRWTLEKCGSAVVENVETGKLECSSNGNWKQVAEFPAMADVASSSFAIQWNAETRNAVKNSGDGLYRVKAFAMDYAVPDSAAYSKVVDLVGAIKNSPSNVKANLWPDETDSLNVTTVYENFLVDTKAPVLNNVKISGKAVAGESGYATLSRPARNGDYAYASGDSLVSITYKVMETSAMVDSASVTVGWNFVHLEDTSKIDRASDSVWVKNGLADTAWTENQGMRLEDGNYEIRAMVRDAAGNDFIYTLQQKLRVDKTAPYIQSLVSSQLIYADTVKTHTAKIVVSEKNDIESNRTGMRCHYRVKGPGITTGWKKISDKVLQSDSVTFVVDSVGTVQGKRYLEAACIDAAGNTSIMTDLFYVGKRAPVITSPVGDDLTTELVAITGIAPPARYDDSVSTIYRLRYADAEKVDSDGSLNWETAQISVVSALQNDSLANVSRFSQSQDAVLGYLNRNLENGGFLEGSYVLELGTCAKGDSLCINGPDSLWLVDTAMVYFGLVDSSESVKPHFDVNLDKPMKIGSDTLDMSLYLSGNTNGNYFMRIYARDSKNVGLFEESVSKVWSNPYFGNPADTLRDEAAIWFYEMDDKYHLQWRGLEIGDSLQVTYNSGDIADVCEGPNGNLENCETRDYVQSMGDLLSVADEIFDDFPALRPLDSSDRQMLVTGESGHMVFSSRGAFHISRVKPVADTKTERMRVYFGSSEVDGFYWIENGGISGDDYNPLMSGWTVNPRVYGLQFRWDGTLETGMYPASGKMKVYAEITENVTKNPFVYLDSVEVDLELDGLKLVVPDTLPDFLLMERDTVKTCSNPDDFSSCVYTAFKLGSMVAYYGVKNRDATVRISVIEGSEVVATLQDSSVTRRANASDSAYQIRWDGKKDDSTSVASQGEYKLRFEAMATDSDSLITLETRFHVKWAGTMMDLTPSYPKNPNTIVPSIIVSETENESDGRYRYEPTADYLVDAKISGYTLPDTSLVNGIPLVGTISGKQEIYKYEPKRFSLAIKRHRKELKLVALYKIDRHLEQIVQKLGSICSQENKQSDTLVYAETFEFNEEKLKDTLHVYNNTFRLVTIPNSIFGGGEKTLLAKLGFDNDKDYLTHVDVIVLMERTVENYLSKNGITSWSAKDFDSLKKSTDIIWKLGDKTNDPDGWHIPRPDGNTHDTTILAGNSMCGNMQEENEFMDTTCSYQDYDANANLFGVHIWGANDGTYYNDYEKLNDDCGEQRWTTLDFYVEFEIPKDYWDAPFGMDNLVNRTIRFDHTNKTIFGNGQNGYWKALEDSSKIGVGTYYDGSEWKTDRGYGLLTPFEIQYLPMFPARDLQGGVNTFLFADEDPSHPQDAQFNLKFYGARDENDYFQAAVVSNPINTCNYAINNFKRNGSTSDKCIIYAMGNNTTVTNTPYYSGSETVEFFVGRNTKIGSVKTDTIDYPAKWNWERDSQCRESQEWTFASNGSAPCYKYYAFGSHVHYYYGDYADTVWAQSFGESNSFVRNLMNTPALSVQIPLDSLFKTTLDASKFGYDSVRIAVKPKVESYNASENKFVVGIDSVEKMQSLLPGVSDAKISLKIDSAGISTDHSNFSLSDNSDTLYITANKFTRNRIYRRSEDSLSVSPVRPNTYKLPMGRIYQKESEWEKGAVLQSAKLMQLDSSDHSHLTVNGNFPDSSDMEIRFRSAESIMVKRPKELVELRAYLKKGYVYQVAYLNDSAFYSLPNSSLDAKWADGIRLDSADGDGWYRLGWFDVNRLQGSTQFMLLWDGNSVDSNSVAKNFAKFEMIVGKSVGAGYRTVKSLFEEASVTFPENSLSENKDITVRTVDAGDYAFDVYNNLALKGPIVEVLPSMTFGNDDALPRIQMKVSREEMKSMNATPQTLRLYKVDFANRKFVPLENVLYGYLKSDGSALVEGSSDTSATCTSAMDSQCYGDDWAYMLISAETHTFSVFTVLDSSVAETPSFGLTILPEIAMTVNRTVRVDGISKYRLYVDDDSLWNAHGDSTPATLLEFTADSNGFARVNLPIRGNAIDTSYVFVVALGEPDVNGNVEELPAAPVVARALTVNVEFVCNVPSDSLWLGLDNGYMAYGASCTHPGYGMVSLYQDGSLVAEMRTENPDTLIYDGSRKNSVGKIADGVYDSRFVGVSSLGDELQMAGPEIYTDSARPVIEGFEVRDSSEVLDRIFRVTAKVTDKESGVAAVRITPVFGNDTLRILNVLPDTAGNIVGIVRLNRKRLSDCAGCVLKISARAVDFGYNYSNVEYASEKLYPYPAELALWYPSYEGGGKTVHEFLGTGHDMDLGKMNSPWKSDVGLYFGRVTDMAEGAGVVDFGSTPSYSFEARIKRGVGYSAWRRVLGFSGLGGLNIELMQRGGVLKLVEGSHSWESERLPFSEKSWAHVVVTVDSAYVKFYVDGELVSTRNSTIDQERELEGSFSLGASSESKSYLGNIADIRMYSRALTAAEVAGLYGPITDTGDVSDVIVVALDDMDAVNGFYSEFSCDLAGNKYLVSGDSANLTMSVIVENSADYNVVLYARSAMGQNARVAVGENSMQTGIANVGNAWRAVSLSGVSLGLAAGTHKISLRIPDGIQIGGVALATANIHASMIAWGVSSADKVLGIASADTVRRVKSYLRYEGYPETSTLRPRIRLENISDEPVNGFSVRYYFRGENASTARVDRYWPNEVSTFPAIHSESANTGYVEWKFSETIPVAGTVFDGQGPHFGLYNSDYVPWNATDDPSFADPNAGDLEMIDGFVEDAGVVVLDADNNLIGGSCAEMEDPVSSETKVRVIASDVRGDGLASEIHVSVENTGNVVLKNFDVRYYFFVEEGLQPVLDVNHISACESAAIESLGSGRWQVNVHCGNTLAPGRSFRDPVNFALHLPGWESAWNAADDPSHDSLETSMGEAIGICVFDSAGYMLYGNAPVWNLPAPEEVDPDSIYEVDFGYSAPDNGIPVSRTDEGLILTLDSWTNLSLNLVTAGGVPVKSLFSGTLAPGEQFVSVDWTGISLNTTYLVLRVNGSIRQTKKLSLM